MIRYYYRQVGEHHWIEVSEEHYYSIKNCRSDCETKEEHLYF